ncbi:MAG TPA: hypothetical protein VK762_23085 [Polyangiaceae bacterium]|nr:hypothetical protein [Polyangiaceae bacterium]
MNSRFACLSVSALALTSWVAGCSSSSPSSASPGTSAAPAAAAHPGADAGGASTNAEGCPVNSGYAGDGMCLPAPPADQGFQLHYGTTDYASSTAVAPFVLPPNNETVDCYYVKTPNDTDVYVGGYQFSMRPGSHHLLVNVNATAQADGFATCGANDQSAGLLGGTMTPTVDERSDPAPENQGLAVKLPANSQAVMNFHVINTSAEPMMREAWMNYYYMNAADVKGYRGNVFLVGGVGFQITPGTHKTYTYSCSPDRPTRILSLSAHMHAHATRMSAWKVTGGQPSLVYENYDWASPTEIRYDSVHQNTMPDPATQTPGGSTGQMILQPTDTLQWECDVDNTSNVTLTFRNEVYTGEMCIMTGVMVPADDPMKPDDFTCTLN